jgi:creatinine amidohydrolase/Fe(II)-dependent formamide hydrolase-like protein
MSIGFDVIVIVNGHGADGQLETGRRLAREFTATTDKTLLFCFGFGSPDSAEHMGGHANISETSIIMHLHPETVDLEALPPKDVPLKTSEWGIADSLLFAGKGNAEHTVQFHPRDSSPELGKQYVDDAAEKLVALVKQTLADRK